MFGVLIWAIIHLRLPIIYLQVVQLTFGRFKMCKVHKLDVFVDGFLNYALDTCELIYIYIYIFILYYI